MKIRHRHLFLFGGVALAIAAALYTDPDTSFISTVLGGVGILEGVWAVAAAHWARKALMDYDEADQRSLFAKAMETSTGAGLALIACAIMFFGLLLVFAPRAHAADLPAGFNTYGPTLKAEQRKFWPDHPDPAALASLVEKESCVSLRSKNCWMPSAQLKTAREEGAGFCQLTRAYGKDGKERFDALSELTTKYDDEIGSLNWSNIYKSPGLQLRACTFKSKDSNMPFKQTEDMLAFGDAALNGGVSGTQKERRACKLTPGCNPAKWFGNVELHCMKSRQPLYGGRSACNINRDHVREVMLERRSKYVPYMNGA